MPISRVKTAVIGCGDISKRYLRHIADTFHIWSSRPAQT